MASGHYVYILTNQSGCFYVGRTAEPLRRWWQHLHREGARHTTRYHVTRLVYLRQLPNKESAARHERSLKRRTRARKWALIRTHNPGIEDLSVRYGWRAPLESSVRPERLE